MTGELHPMWNTPAGAMYCTCCYAGCDCGCVEVCTVQRMFDQPVFTPFVANPPIPDDAAGAEKEERNG